MITPTTTPPNLPGVTTQAASPSEIRPSITETLKKKRGRPSLAEERAKLQAEFQTQAPAPIKEVFKPDMVAGLTNVPFSFCALLTKNPDWNLSPEDQNFVAPSLADVLNEIYPELVGKYPRLAVLAVMYTGVFLKKSGELMVKAQKKPVVPVPEKAKPKPPEAVLDGDGLSPAEKVLRDRMSGNA